VEGIKILFNCAEEVYRMAGYGVNDILFHIVIGSVNLGLSPWDLSIVSAAAP
jgi:hypothetical protein